LQRVWLVGALGVLALGLIVRSVLGGGGVGELSGIVLALVLWLSVWICAVLLTTPRTAFWIGLMAMAALDLAAVPPTTREYDDRIALYRTDQALPLSPQQVAGASYLAVLVEPVFEGPTPQFGLSAEVGNTSVSWTCPWRRGMQWVTLPIPAGADTTNVRLRVYGTPARDGDYLLVYASAARGGYLAEMRTTADADTTRCSAQ
jgi:hypothetical protein